MLRRRRQQRLVPRWGDCARLPPYPASIGHQSCGESTGAHLQVVHAALDKPRSFSIKGASADIVTETDKLSEEAVLKVRAVLEGGCAEATAPHHRALSQVSLMRHVLQVLRQRYPDHAVLGEEGGVVGNTESDYLW